MTLNDFAKEVTLVEGKKKSLSIAQIKEVLRAINFLTGGAFYRSIRNLRMIRKG